MVPESANLIHLTLFIVDCGKIRAIISIAMRGNGQSTIYPKVVRPTGRVFNFFCFARMMILIMIKCWGLLNGSEFAKPKFPLLKESENDFGENGCWYGESTAPIYHCKKGPMKE